MLLPSLVHGILNLLCERLVIFFLKLLDGTKIHASANFKKLKLLEQANTLLIERRKGDSSPAIA